MKKLSLALTCCLLFGALPAHAGPWSQGEARSIDVAKHSMTIKHSALTALDVPAMTMTFQVPDATWLASTAQGDRFEFQPALIKGALTVTAHRPVPAASAAK